MNDQDYMDWEYRTNPVFWGRIDDFVLADRYSPDGTLQHLVLGSVSAGTVVDKAQVIGTSEAFPNGLPDAVLNSRVKTLSDLGLSDMHFHEGFVPRYMAKCDGLWWCIFEYGPTFQNGVWISEGSSYLLGADESEGEVDTPECARGLNGADSLFYISTGIRLYPRLWNRFKTLTDAQRLELIHSCCNSCGSLAPCCVCGNDE